jgi:hypothetical protein
MNATTSTITKNVTSALNAVKAAQGAHVTYVAAIAALRPSFEGYEAAGITDVLRPIIAKYYGLVCKVNEKTGRVNMPEGSEAARQALSRIVKDIIGKTNDKAAPTKVRLSAAESAAFVALLAACGGDAKRAAVVFKCLA